MKETVASVWISYATKLATSSKTQFPNQQFFLPNQKKIPHPYTLDVEMPKSQIKNANFHPIFELLFSYKG